MNLLEQAFDEFDIDKLRTAIAQGEDINGLGEIGEPLWENALFCYVDPEDYASDHTEDKRIILEFLKEAVEMGLDLNVHYFDNIDKETYYSKQFVLRYSCFHDIEFVKALFELGMNADTDEWTDKSLIDDIYEDMFAEEACGYNDNAKWYYEVCRFLVSQGGKSIYERTYYHKAALPYKDGIDSIDLSCIEKLDAESIIKNELDYELIDCSKYCYPKQFYDSSLAMPGRPGTKLEDAIIEGLEKMVEIIGIENISKYSLEACVELQYPKVMKYLLDAGANPNVNCFTPSYFHIRSSALYTARVHGYLLPKGLADEMIGLLLAAGARE